MNFLKTAPDHYSFMAKLIHWSMAIIILLMLSSGFLMELLENSPFKIQIFSLHKSFGFLVLFLLLFRIAWRFIAPSPPSLPTHATWEKGLAHLAHFILYGLMLGLPLSGWIMSSAGDFPAAFFGLEMPDLVEKSKDIFRSARQAHGLMALIALAVIGLHMAGAFKHEYIDRDSTLRRMTSPKLGMGSVFLLTAVLGALWLSPLVLMQMEEEHSPEQKVDQTNSVTINDMSAVGVNPNSWLIMQDDSVITFKATQYGSAFEGKFDHFNGTIIFDPQNLKESEARIEIDLTSINTGSSDRDTQAFTQDWFWTEKFPTAQFKTIEIKNTGPNQFETEGILKIKDIEQALSFPFTLDIKDLDDGTKRADMTANFQLERTDFDVGVGDWADGTAIGKVVEIKLHVIAEKRPK